MERNVVWTRSVRPVCGFVVVELHLNLWLRLLVAFSRCLETLLRIGEEDKKLPTALELRVEG